jgi:hypothetical protein
MAKAAGKGLECESHIYTIDPTQQYNVGTLCAGTSVTEPGLISRIRVSLENLRDDSQLVIRGHGSCAGMTVGGVRPIPMARFLLQCGLTANCTISFTSCKVGRNPALATELSLAPYGVNHISDDSFAKTFHRLLHVEGNLRNEVYARVYNVRVLANGSKTTRTDGEEDRGMHTSHQDRSKVKFYWSETGIEQKVYWKPHGLDDVPPEIDEHGYPLN